jgi:hypothetical protein
LEYLHKSVTNKQSDNTVKNKDIHTLQRQYIHTGGRNFTILPGYTDMKASSACIILTKELKITKPIIPTDESDVHVSFSIPDLSQAIDDSNIEIVHGLNLTQLQEYFATQPKIYPWNKRA